MALSFTEIETGMFEGKKIKRSDWGILCLNPYSIAVWVSYAFRKVAARDNSQGHWRINRV